jgi:hypothetical protein
MATQNSVPSQMLAVSAEQGAGDGCVEQVEGRTYARPEVHDLGSLELVQGWYGTGFDHGANYYRVW